MPQRDLIRVNLEVDELLTERGQRRFQARLRMADIVIANIGSPQVTELEAFDVLVEALAAGAREMR